MAAARTDGEMQRLSMLLAVLVNCHKAKGPAVKPTDFYEPRGRRKPKPIPAGIRALRVFVDGQLPAEYAPRDEGWHHGDSGWYRLSPPRA